MRHFFRSTLSKAQKRRDTRPLLSALLILALICAMTACGKTPPESDASVPPPSSPADAGDTGPGSGAEDELLAAGREVVEGHFDALMREDAPAEARILSYTLDSLAFMAGDEKEFCVSIRYSYTQAENHPNANGTNTQTADGAFLWRDCYLEFRIKDDGHGDWEIVSIGTGGGGAGLAFPGAPGFEEARDIVATLLERVLDAHFVLQMEGLPTVPDSVRDDHYRRLDNETPVLDLPTSDPGYWVAYQQGLAARLHSVADVEGFYAAAFTEDAVADLMSRTVNDRYEVYKEFDGKLYVNSDISPAPILGGECDLDTLELLESSPDTFTVQIVKTWYEPETVRFTVVRENGRWRMDSSYYTIS